VCCLVEPCACAAGTNTALTRLRALRPCFSLPCQLTCSVTRPHSTCAGVCWRAALSCCVCATPCSSIGRRQRPPSVAAHSVGACQLHARALPRCTSPLNLSVLADVRTALLFAMRQAAQPGRRRLPRGVSVVRVLATAHLTRGGCAACRPLLPEYNIWIVTPEKKRTPEIERERGGCTAHAMRSHCAPLCSAVKRRRAPK
jgi:hypothetical protein